MFGIAVELELEIARAGVFLGVGDTALAFDLVVQSDGMADCDPLQPPAPPEELRDVVISEVRRQPRVDPRNILRHAVEKADIHRAQQGVHNRLVDFRGPEDGGERRNVLRGAGLDLRGDTRGVQAKRSFES